MQFWSFYCKHHERVAQNIAQSVGGGGLTCVREELKNKYPPPSQLKDAFVQREQRKETLSMKGRKHTVTTQEAQLWKLVVCN